MKYMGNENVKKYYQIDAKKLSFFLYKYINHKIE